MGKFSDLPREVMLDILTRLPTESVLECKLVCKPWNNVVGHQSFSQLHLNRLRAAAAAAGDESGFIFFSRVELQVQDRKSAYDTRTHTQEFYYSEYESKKPFSRKTRINLDPPFEGYSFAGSCNGLICFKSRHNGANYGPFYICNPITREYIILPELQGQYICGFGYCPSTNEYKVVRIGGFGYSGVKVVQVYTLGSGIGWRSLSNTDINLKYGSAHAGAFVNGALHWKDDIEGTILSFSLADEKCTALPYTPRQGAGETYLGVLGDFLSFTCYHGIRTCEIWLLKKNKYNDAWRWSKEFSFETDIPHPFGFINSGSVIETFIPRSFGFMKSSGRLLCCQLSMISCYNLKSSAKIDVSFGKDITEAIPHTNTLVSLKALGEKDVKTNESSRASSSKVMESSA